MRAKIAFAATTLLIHSIAYAGPGPCVLGTSWETVDELTQTQGLGSIANGMAHNAYAVVAAGTRVDAQDNGHWLIRRSLDGGDTWQTTLNGLAGYASSYASSVAAGPGGELYAAGAGSHSSNQSSWIVQKSLDSGASWFTVDTFDGTAATPTSAADQVAVDGNGVVYVAGTMYSTTQHLVWTVRRSTDGGASWQTVDTYQLTAQRDSVPFGLAASEDGHVFAAGQATPDPSDDYWITRESDDGVTWQTVDQFKPNPGQNIAQANGVAISSSGDVSVVGQVIDPTFTYHWTVRHATLSAPTSWTTTDDRVAQGTSSIATAEGATYTGDDELFVTGYTIGGPGAQATWALTNLTRSGTATSELSDTDTLIDGVTAGQAGYATFGGRAATTDAWGDVFTGGAYLSSTTEPTHWIIRRLVCESGGK